MVKLGWALLVWGIYKTLRRPLFDHDLWWHLNAGRTMVENHVFLRTETFSHTRAGAPWINFEWLGQLFFYELVKWGGLKTLLYGKVAAGFFVVAALVFLLRCQGASGPVLLLGAAVGFPVLNTRLYERIEMATLFFLPLLLALLTLARCRPSFRRPGWLAAVFVLMVLWVNLHGGFVYGIATVFLLAVGARWAREAPAVVSFYDRVFVVALVALLFNPFGWRLAHVFVEHAVQMKDHLIIEEWAPPSVDKNLAFWLLFVAAGVAWVAGFFTHRAAAAFWGPLVLIFSVWSARHVRTTALLPFAVLPFMADVFQPRLPRWRAWLSLLSVLPLLSLLSAICKPTSPMVVQQNRFPFAACEFIQKHNITGTMYNTYHLGGAIEWALGPSQKIFIDGRYLFHPLLMEIAQLDQDLLRDPDGTAWARFLAAYGVDYAIVDYVPFEIASGGKTPFSLTWANLAFPRSDWALVYWDDGSLVFLKRTARFARLIKELEYKSVWPYNLNQMQALLTTEAVSAADMKAELTRQAREVPISLLRAELQKLLPRS